MYKMKSWTVLIILAAVLVIFLSLTWSTGNVTPFSDQREYASFESMSNYGSSSSLPPPSSTSMLISAAPGMEGIFESPDSNRMIDTFSSSKSSPNCTATNLTTQGGNVCLSPEQLKLLQSRGNNCI